MSTDPTQPSSPEPSMPPPPETGAPGTPVPGYPPPPPYGYPPYPYPYQRAPETNSMAIVAMIMIFVFPPLAIIFGFIAKNQIDRTGEQGRGFAIAGIAGGIAVTALWVAIIVFYVFLFSAFFHDFSQHGLLQPN